jgi:hypothetical protein
MEGVRPDSQICDKADSLPFIDAKKECSPNIARIDVIMGPGMVRFSPSEIGNMGQDFGSTLGMGQVGISVSLSL